MAQKFSGPWFLVDDKLLLLCAHRNELIALFWWDFVPLMVGRWSHGSGECRISDTKMCLLTQNNLNPSSNAHNKINMRISFPSTCPRTVVLVWPESVAHNIVYAFVCARQTNMTPSRKSNDSVQFLFQTHTHTPTYWLSDWRHKLQMHTTHTDIWHFCIDMKFAIRKRSLFNRIANKNNKWFGQCSVYFICFALCGYASKELMHPARRSSHSLTLAGRTPPPPKPKLAYMYIQLHFACIYCKLPANKLPNQSETKSKRIFRWT